MSVTTVARRIAVALSVCLSALIASSATDARRAPIGSYCSPTGDYCMGIFRQDGAILFGIDAFFGGRYSICVTDPLGDRQCKSFRLYSRGGKYRNLRSGQVRWFAAFGSSGPGVYRVAWYYPACDLCRRRPIGRVLRFRVN